MTVKAVPARDLDALMDEFLDTTQYAGEIRPWRNEQATDDTDDDNEPDDDGDDDDRKDLGDLPEHVPESIEESGRKAAEQTANARRKTAAILDQIPDGTTVRIQRTDWTKESIRGEKTPFWTSKKGGKTSEQMADDISAFVKAGLIARDVVMEHFPHHERLLPKQKQDLTALQLGDLPGHPFRGNQWSDGRTHEAPDTGGGTGGGHWEKASGGTEHWVGPGKPPPEPRRFKDDEGFDWHEQGPVAAWAEKLPYKDSKAIDDYAGFGYADINRHLRGTFEPRIVNETVREATAEEIAAYKFPPMGHGDHADDYDENDPLNKVDDGRIVHRFYYKGGYKKDGPNERVDSYHIERAGPDEKYVKQIEAKTNTINESIRERGYELPEPISVNRAAYIPGLSHEDLKAMEGGIMEEKGFTSTMVGNPNKRLNGYVAQAKYESIYKRTGGKTVEQDEVGTAMRIEIVLPKGTKVVAVEPVRRMEYEFPRVPIDDPRPPDVEEKYWTRPDYSAKPVRVKTDGLKDKGQRTEAEVLLGSGAQFRIVSVEDGKPIHSSDRSLKAVPVMDVKLEYIGGGSSEGTP